MVQANDRDGDVDHNLESSSGDPGFGGKGLGGGGCDSSNSSSGSHSTGGSLSSEVGGVVAASTGVEDNAGG